MQGIDTKWSGVFCDNCDSYVGGSSVNFDLRGLWDWEPFCSWNYAKTSLGRKEQRSYTKRLISRIQMFQGRNSKTLKKTFIWKISFFKTFEGT